MRKANVSTITRLLLPAILAVAAGVRFLHLGEPSLWWDEFITLGIARMSPRDLLHTLYSVAPSDIGVELFPPLYHLIVHAVLSFSKSDAALKSISVVFGTLSLAVLYGLVRSLFNWRAGLYAALLGALSVFHIHYSRELRPYSLFFLLSLLSLLFLYKALAGGRARYWIAFVPATVGMLYCSYMAATTIAAEGLFAALFLASGLRGGHGKGRILRQSGLFALCLAVSLAAYLPWLPAQRFIYQMLSANGPSHGLSWPVLGNAVVEFGAYAAPHRSLPWLPLTALAAVGMVVGLGRRSRLGYALLALWALMPLVAFQLAGTTLDISSRYLFSFYYFLLACAGLGIDWLFSSFFAFLRSGDDQFIRLRVVCGLFACIAVSAPNLESLPDYYRRETSYYKDLADYLAWNQDNAPYLLLETNRNLKLVTGWYLPGVYKRFDTFDSAGYKRVRLLTQANPTLQYPSHFMARIQDQSVYAMGIVNGSPLILYPDKSGNASFAEDFTGFGMYSHCEKADNLVPEPISGSLVNYEFLKAGHVQYSFRIPPGTRLGRATMTLRLVGMNLSRLKSDSRITLSMSVGKEPFAPVAVLDRNAFLLSDGSMPSPDKLGRSFVDKTFPLDVARAAGQDLRLRIDYGPVREPGVVAVAGFRLDAALDGAPQGPGEARMAFDSVAGNVRVVRWRPGVSLMGTQAIHAFSCDDGAIETTADSPWNPASDLKGFLAEHPDAKPVAAIDFPDGRAAFRLYDPCLTEPFLTLDPRGPARVDMGAGAPGSVAGLRLAGRFDNPVLTIDGRALDVPVQAPEGSHLMLGEGEGVLRFEPAFTNPLEVAQELPDASDIVKNKSEDCVSCGPSGHCRFTVHIASRYPVKTVRVAAYPRIFADKEGKNRVLVLLSQDGGPFKLMDELASDGSEVWEGLMARRISVARLATPARDVAVRFELFGSGAQLWSPKDRRMRVEAVLDASGYAPPAMNGRISTVEMEGAGDSPLRVLPTFGPARYLPGLQRNF